MVHSLGVDVQESIVQLAEFIQAEVEVMVASKPEEKGPKVKSATKPHRRKETRRSVKLAAIAAAEAQGCGRQGDCEGAARGGGAGQHVLDCARRRGC